MYIIQKTSMKVRNTEVLKKGYNTKDEAIKFVKSQLNSEELENSRKIKQRGLQEDTEYYSKDYIYEIIEIEVL